MQGKITNHIGFGCASLTSLPFESKALRLLNTAYNVGIRSFDTAPLYGNGYSEVIVGKFIRNKRKEIILTTKFGLKSHGNVNVPVWLALPANYLKKKSVKKYPHTITVISPPISLIPFRKIDKQEIESSFIKSTQALKTDYIDNFLLHEAMPSFLTENALSYLLNLKKDGKVLKIGVASGYLNLVDYHNFNGWDVVQYENGHLFHSDSLLSRLPAKLHIYHSVLKGLKKMCVKDINSFELAAILLLSSIHKNPLGKVLFACSKAETLINNMEALEKLKNMDQNDVKSILYAIH